jgi:hypothetical protein
MTTRVTIGRTEYTVTRSEYMATLTGPRGGKYRAGHNSATGLWYVVDGRGRPLRGPRGQVWLRWTDGEGFEVYLGYPLDAVCRRCVV